MEGIRFNTRLKSVTTRWPQPLSTAGTASTAGAGPAAGAGPIELHFPSGDNR
jgi:hypothetical protein